MFPRLNRLWTMTKVDTQPRQDVCDGNSWTIGHKSDLHVMFVEFTPLSISEAQFYLQTL